MGPGNNGVPKGAGQVDATQVSVAPSAAVPDSNVRRALERLAGSLTAAQYVADLAYALGQVVNGEARKARLAARSAEAEARMAQQLAAVTAGATRKARLAARNADAQAQMAQQTAFTALGGLHRLRRRVTSDQIALTAQVFN